jgi:hypothetical protein
MEAAPMVDETRERTTDTASFAITPVAVTDCTTGKFDARAPEASAT